MTMTSPLMPLVTFCVRSEITEETSPSRKGISTCGAYVVSRGWWGTEWELRIRRFFLAASVRISSALLTATLSGLEIFLSQLSDSTSRLLWYKKGSQSSYLADRAIFIRWVTYPPFKQFTGWWEEFWRRLDQFVCVSAFHCLYVS